MQNLGALSRKHWVCDSRKGCCMWNGNMWDGEGPGCTEAPWKLDQLLLLFTLCLLILFLNISPWKLSKEVKPIKLRPHHDWSQSLKFLIRVSSQHRWHCRLSPQVYAQQLSLSAMMWASEFLIIWCYNRICYWPIGVKSCHVPQWRANQMPDTHVCQGVGQKSHKNKMAYFVSEISEGLLLVEIALAQCKKNKYYTLHSPTLYVNRDSLFSWCHRRLLCWQGPKFIKVSLGYRSRTSATWQLGNMTLRRREPVQSGVPSLQMLWSEPV